MKIIVIGAGNVGTFIIQELSKEGHDLVVIDTDLKKINTLVNYFDVLGVHGSGVIAEVLEEADITRADMLIAVAQNDEINLLSCLMAKSYGVPNTIARVRKPEYSKQAEFMRDRLGVTFLVNPEEELAAEITRMLRFPFASKVESIAHGKVDLVEFIVSEDSPLVGKAVKDVITIFKIDFLVCAATREGVTMIPDGNFVFRSGDVLNVTATPKNIESFFRKIGKFRKKAHGVLIAGGGMLGYYVANTLNESGFNVKIIDPSTADSLKLRDTLHKKINVVVGDASKKDLMEEEGIDYCDAIVALTESDEKNIVISLLAKNRNVSKIITKVTSDFSKILLDEVNLDSVVSTKKVTGAQITRIARSISSSGRGGLLKLYKIARDQAEALVFDVGNSEDFVGKAVKELRFRENTLIACVIRDREIIIPNGLTVFCENDAIVIVTTKENLTELKDVLR